MGRGTLWAATAGPEPSAADIERIATELNLSIPADAAPSVLFRALRTLLNLTQKEFGVLIAPGGSNPISASVICQLETGLQPLPALLITCAATAATAVQRFGNWRRAEHAGCHDSALSALRALNAGCEAEIESFVAAQAELPDIERELVGTYLAVVSKRKSSGLTDRPATRAPYKKGAKKGEGKEEGSEGKEKKECAARGPRGSYKVKKRLPQAVALSSADSSDGASTPTHSSEGSSVCSSELSAATTCPNSPADGGSDGGCDLPDMRIGLDELRLFDACDDTSCDGAGGGCNGGAGADEGGGSGAVTPRTKSSLDFLARLEDAERRDQDTLRSAREQGVKLTPRAVPRKGAAAAAAAAAAMPAPPAPPVVPAHLESRSLLGRSPRDSPRGGESTKRRNTRCHVGDGELTRDVLLSVVDLDKLNLDDFTLEELMMASPRGEGAPLQGVDEIVDLVCRDLASPTWSETRGDAPPMQECEC